MKKTTGIFLLVIMLGLTQVVLGVIPQKWEFYRITDYLEGKFQGVSVTHNGVLSLSPREEKVEGPPEEFYLSLHVSAGGTLYLGTGHSGKIYKIRADGKQELFFQAPEMHVYCLAEDPKGNIYAGTSPSGKIYKITPDGKGETFFDPRERYIWDLMFMKTGNLLAAVGESGGIYEINPRGEGTQILKAGENHILCMTRMEEGGLLAGSGGKGLVYRIIPGQKPAVLFESAYEEIRTLVLDEEGNIYAAAGGVAAAPKKDALALLREKPAVEITVTATPEAAPAQKIPAPIKKQPGALYRLNQEGLARKIWSSEEEMVYSLVWDRERKELVFATGDKGRVYALDQEEKVSLILQKESEQVYLLLPVEKTIYVLSNNPPALSRLLPEQRLTGEYTSRVLDARAFSRWGRIAWEAEVPEGASLQFQTRSGNSAVPDRTWSEWSPPYKKSQGEQILSPKARYLQFRMALKAESSRVSPALKKLTLFYIHHNRAPQIKELKLLPPNEVYLKPPDQKEVIWGEDVRVFQKADQEEKAQTYITPKKVKRKGYQTITWAASDENQDALVYALFIRREDEADWRPLKSEWAETIFAFDTTSFPDGVYYLKVQASDAPSNPRGTELTAEKVTRPFVIDNTAPSFLNFQVRRQGRSLQVAFDVEDALSVIQDVRFQVRPLDWRVIFPEDGLCDSRRENFRFSVGLPADADNLIVVRAKDSHGNVGVYRATF
ncbi:MAG: hypothetical protein ACE5LV_02380 [Candidatus Aminicenantales bacterium]